ncbi:hypothetical protein [Streptomyces sp. NPDC000878]
MRLPQPNLLIPARVVETTGSGIPLHEVQAPRSSSPRVLSVTGGAP